MAPMNIEARATLRAAGLTTRKWAQINGYAGAADWRGDDCGCTDDRCIGHHHNAEDPCECLPVLIAQRAPADASAGS